MRVVRAEAFAALLAEHALHQRAEDGRVDGPPVELRGLLQVEQFAAFQKDLGRFGKQLAVDVAGSRVSAVPILVAFLIEQLEEIPDVARRVRLRLSEQLVDRRLQRVGVEHPEVFGEQAPDDLHGEPLDLVDGRRTAVRERGVQLGDVAHGLGRQ